MIYLNVIKRMKAICRKISASRRQARYFAIFGDPEFDNFITNIDENEVKKLSDLQ